MAPGADRAAIRAGRLTLRAPVLTALVPGRASRRWSSGCPSATRTRARSSSSRRSPYRPDILDSLEALASQVSLALEAASLAENLHRQKSEARFRSLVAHSSDLITVLDATGVVTYQSPSIERVLGYSVDEIEGTRFDRLLADADRSRLSAVVSGAGGPGPRHTRFECSLQHHDGRWLQFEVHHTHLLHDEHIRGIVLNSRDISERKAFEDQLAHQAFHDPVTNLANRALFADRVQHALRSTVRRGSLIGVMFIDLDDFKTVNDSLGHPAGDAILQEVARRLEGVVRPADTVARFGGDEFAILLDGVDGSDEAAHGRRAAPTRARGAGRDRREAGVPARPASASA